MPYETEGGGPTGDATDLPTGVKGDVEKEVAPKVKTPSKVHVIIKLFAFIFNFLELIFGLAALACAVGMITVAGKGGLVFKEKNLLLIFVTFILLGLFALAAAIDGICAAWMESRGAAIGSMVLNGFILSFAIAITILVLTFSGKEKIKKILKGDLEAYNKNEDHVRRKPHQGRVFMYQVERSLNCCGVEGPGDYKDKSGETNNSDRTLPVSCCNYEFKLVKKPDEGAMLHKNCTEKTLGPKSGCLNAALDWIRKSRTYAFAAGGGLVFSFFGSMATAIFVCCVLRQKKSDIKPSGAPEDGGETGGDATGGDATGGDAEEEANEDNI